MWNRTDSLVAIQRFQWMELGCQSTFWRKWRNRIDTYRTLVSWLDRWECDLWETDSFLVHAVLFVGLVEIPCKNGSDEEKGGTILKVTFDAERTTWTKSLEMGNCNVEVNELDNGAVTLLILRTDSRDLDWKSSGRRQCIWFVTKSICDVARSVQFRRSVSGPLQTITAILSGSSWSELLSMTVMQYVSSEVSNVYQWLHVVLAWGHEFMKDVRNDRMKSSYICAESGTYLS